MVTLLLPVVQIDLLVSDVAPGVGVKQMGILAAARAVAIVETAGVIPLASSLVTAALRTSIRYALLLQVSHILVYLAITMKSKQSLHLKCSIDDNISKENWFHK